MAVLARTYRNGTARPGVAVEVRQGRRVVVGNGKAVMEGPGASRRCRPGLAGPGHGMAVGVRLACWGMDGVVGPGMAVMEWLGVARSGDVGPGSYVVACFVVVLFGCSGRAV